MKHLSRSTLTIATVLSLLILAGCEREGPAERAGEALDDAARETRDQMEQGREEIEDCIETEFNDC